MQIPSEFVNGEFLREPVLPDLPPPPDFFVGLDLGQLHDPSAACIVQRGGLLPVYAVTDLRRWPLRTPYPKVVEDVAGLLRGNVLDGPVRLVIDGTGVGRAVVDLFREALPEFWQAGKIVAVTITAGSSSAWDAGSSSWHVAKKDLVGVLQALFGTRALRIQEKLEYAAVLRKELEEFSVKVDPVTAHESFEAWRVRDHDDLCIALTLCLWDARRTPRPYGAAMPAKLTAGYGEQGPARKMGAVGFGAERRDELPAGFLEW